MRSPEPARRIGLSRGWLACLEEANGLHLYPRIQSRLSTSLTTGNQKCFGKDSEHWQRRKLRSCIETT